VITIGEILGPGGALARSIPGYEVRPGQLDMAEQVADALRTRRPLMVEAGTGTGKTLAYLVPAVLSGLKVVISTGTKNLQEQIFRKDIPLLQRELSFKAACMKGISNYLCLRRFSEYSANSALGISGEPDVSLDSIRDWARITESGDRAELPDLADDAPIWREISATPETRLGPGCPHFERCFVTQARRRAQGAEIVIVNHHLFFADLSLRAAWPNAQLLPKYEAVIFDEAHQLEDVATDYFGVGVSTLRLGALIRDCERAVSQGNAPHKLDLTLGHVEARARILFDELRLRLKRDEKSPIHAEIWRGPPEKAAHALDTALEELEAALGGAHDCADGGEVADSLANRARSIRDDLSTLVDGAQKHDRKHVFWAETRGKSVLLHASPVDVSNIVRQHVLGAVDTAIFTSATLTAAGNFDFVRARLGLDSALEARLASPFDYSEQALLYLPRDLPAPADDGFAEKAAERMFELVQITDGRAFLLFTSYRQLERVHRLLAPRLKQPVLVQGEKPKHLLVEEFKRKVGSVLFATASFWEGVDVVGEALSLVVIDKLPFAPPDDPIVAARSARLEDEGQDPFHTYQIPRAALALAQGFGRLIRHRGDRGIVALLDRRAVTKPYGRRVLAGLPSDCPRTGSLDDVRQFWTRQLSLAV
jgi:ATP-dependent DNA helicase DinG